MNTRPTFTALLCGLVLGACATPGRPPPELVRARAAVNDAAADPAVLSSASAELKRATESLQRANALHNERASLADIASASYVAEQQARTAMLLAQAKRSEDAIASAQAERERARADAKAAEARAAREKAAAAEQRATTAQAAATDAQQEAALLRQRLAELQTRETERGLLVTLGDVLFEFGRADIRPTAHAALRKLADFMAQYPTRTLLIEGHTDSVGSHAANQALSLRRAQSVAAALIGMGVAPQRIQTVGYGEDFPVADNTTDTNRALNRRVEVYISQGDRPVRLRR